MISKIFVCLLALEMTLSRGIKQKIVTLAEHTSKSQREIANELSISRYAVQTTLRLWRETSSVDDDQEERRGRKPKLTAREKKMIVRESTKDPKKTAREIQQVSGQTVKTVSLRTVQRVLQESGKIAYRPRKIPALTKSLKIRRFQWSNEVKDMCLNDWNEVIFSDETYLEVSSPRTRFVRRCSHEKPRGEHFDHRKGYAPKVMIWGCISSRGLGKIAIVQGTMDSAKYIEILKTHLLPQASKWFPSGDWTFQQDGARCHTSRQTMAFFDDFGIPLLPWTASSPDLNPIENVWSLLKTRVNRMGSSTKEELMNNIMDVAADEEFWKDRCAALVESMLDRVNHIRRTRGFPFTGRLSK